MNVCAICSKPDCDIHADAVVVHLDPDLIRRLERRPSRDLAWARYHIDQAGVGIIPVTFAVNPPNAPLTGTFWVRAIRHQKVRLDQAFISLVQVNETHAAKTLYLHESATTFRRRGTLLLGRAEGGFFAFSTSANAPETTRRETVGEWFADVSALEALTWEPGHFPGVIRQASVVDRTYANHSPAATVYDHRERPEVGARVVATRKITHAQQVFEHCDLYPADGQPLLATVILGSWNVQLPDDMVAEYIFQSTSHQRRVQSTTLLIIATRLATPGLDEVELELAVLNALEDGNPVAICNAYEALILARVANGHLVVTPEHEALWGRYQACRARAERSNFENEADVAWEKAVALLRRLSNFPNEEGCHD